MLHLLPKEFDKLEAIQFQEDGERFAKQRDTLKFIGEYKKALHAVDNCLVLYKNARKCTIHQTRADELDAIILTAKTEVEILQQLIDKKEQPSDDSY